MKGVAAPYREVIILPVKFLYAFASGEEEDEEYKEGDFVAAAPGDRAYFHDNILEWLFIYNKVEEKARKRGRVAVMASGTPVPACFRDMSIAVMLGFVRPFDRYADVVRLLCGEYG
jgi:hypothetical protein